MVIALPQKNISKNVINMINLKYLFFFICFISFSEGISSSDANNLKNDQKTQIFIIYGQSNASGRGELSLSEIISLKRSSFKLFPIKVFNLVSNSLLFGFYILCIFNFIKSSIISFKKLSEYENISPLFIVSFL